MPPSLRTVECSRTPGGQYDRRRSNTVEKTLLLEKVPRLPEPANRLSRSVRGDPSAYRQTTPFAGVAILVQLGSQGCATPLPVHVVNQLRHGGPRTSLGTVDRYRHALQRGLQRQRPRVR